MDIRQKVKAADGTVRIEMKCIGFGKLELPLGEGDTWEEAFARATKLIFAA